MKKHLWKISALVAVIIYPVIEYGLVPHVPEQFAEYVSQLGALFCLIFFLVSAILLYETDDK